MPVIICCTLLCQVGRGFARVPAVAQHIGMSQAVQFALCGLSVTAMFEIAWAYGLAGSEKQKEANPQVV